MAGRKKMLIGKNICTLTVQLTEQELALVDAMKDQLKLPNRSYLGRLALAMHLSMLKAASDFETPPELLDVDFFSSLREDIARDLKSKKRGFVREVGEDEEFNSAA